MLAKILLVSNSTAECFTIKNALSEYLIVTAYDCSSAILKIEENFDIDIIMLDLDMPDMEGFKILKFLKSNKKHDNLRIVILANEHENEIKGLQLGAHDYIRRPINIDSLIEIISVQNLYIKAWIQGLTFDAIFNQSPIGITVSHSLGPLNEDDFIVNPVFEEFTGRNKSELAKLGWANITHPDDLELDLINFNKFQSREIDTYSMDKRYIKPDGSNVWGHMVVARLNLHNSYAYNHICFVQDITKRKEMEKVLAESERSKSVLLSHLPGLAYRCKYDKDWTMLFVSEGCFDLTGYYSESLLYNRELSFNDIIAPEYHDSLWNEWKRIIEKRLPFKYEYEIITSDKKRKWVLEMAQANFNESGEVESLEGMVLDISDRKKIENDLKYNNEHDKWTGLYNRSYLEDILTKDLKICTKEKRALVGVNLNSMHLLTMTYGFHYSQDLIKKVANALNKFHCSDNCMLFNSYEYRFVFYVKNYKDKNELINFCEEVSSTLESLLYMERIGGGIGIVEIDDNNKNDVNQLLKNLLISSERAINIYDRDFSFCFFDKEFHEKIIREEEIKKELAKISANESIDSNIFLEFQAILDVKSNTICAFEALARINSEKLGFISPREFIPIAEKTKLIIPLGQKIIIHAFNFLNMLKNSGYDDIRIFINISAIQLQNKHFVKILLELINEMEVNPRNIVIEITESVYVSNYNEMNKIFNELKNIGINIAIDDFGTGYSSLARERELNVDCIKIDKDFIDNLLLLKEEESITGDIITMFHRLGHCVIAEGVEYEKQQQYLKKHGCDKIQGYLVSKPIGIQEAIKLLSK